MNKNQYIILAIIAIALGVIIFTPDEKKEGESRKLFEYQTSEIINLRYHGEIDYYGEKVKAHFTIAPEPYPAGNMQYLFKYRIIKITPEDAIKKADLAQKAFYGGTILKGMFNDFRQLNVQYQVEKPSPEQLEKFGLAPCQSEIALMTRDRTHTFCIGTTNYGNARRYLLDKASGIVYLVHNHLISRYEKNTYHYRDQRLVFFERRHITSAFVKINKKYEKKYPHLFKEKAGLLDITSEQKINPATKKEYTRWSVHGLDHAGPAAFERLVEVAHDVKLIAFAPERPADLKPADLEITFFQEKDGKKSELERIELWLGGHNKNWLLSKSKNPLNQGDSFAAGKRQMGLYRAIQVKNIEDALKRIDTEVQKHQILIKRQLEEIKKRHLDAPSKPVLEKK